MFRFLFRLIVIVGFPGTAAGDNVDDLLREIQSARNEIRCGHFVATGKLSSDDNLQESQVDIWFSTDAFRVNLSRLSSRTEEHTVSGERVRVLKVGPRAFVRVEDQSVASATAEQAQSLANYFDARSVGLADSFEMQRAASIEQIIRIYRESGIPMRLERLSGGLLQLTRGPFAGRGKQVITIDPFRGYVPMESRLFYGPGNQQLVRSTWEKIDEVWVPTKVKILSRDVLKVDLSLDWKSVNSIPDTTVFDPQFFFAGDTLPSDR